MLLDFDYDFLADQTKGYSSSDIVDFVSSVMASQTRIIKNATHFTHDSTIGKYYPCIKGAKGCMKMSFTDIKKHHQFIYPPIDMCDFLTCPRNKSCTEDLNPEYLNFHEHHGTLIAERSTGKKENPPKKYVNVIFIGIGKYCMTCDYFFRKKQHISNTRNNERVLSSSVFSKDDDAVSTFEKYCTFMQPCLNVCHMDEYKDFAIKAQLQTKNMLANIKTSEGYQLLKKIKMNKMSEKQSLEEILFKLSNF